MQSEFNWNKSVRDRKILYIVLDIVFFFFLSFDDFFFYFSSNPLGDLCFYVLPEFIWCWWFVLIRTDSLEIVIIVLALCCSGCCFRLVCAMCGGVVDIWVLHLVFDVSAERTTIHFNMPTQSNNLTKYNNRKYINCLIRSTFAVLSTFALCKLAIFSSLRSLFCFPFIRQTLTVPSYIYSLFVCLLFRAAQAHIFFAGLEKYRFIWCLFLGFAFQSNSILYFSFPIGKYWFFAVWWCVFFIHLLFNESIFANLLVFHRVPNRLKTEHEKWNILVRFDSYHC